MKEPCFRCKRPTYINDKVGPLKDGALFHKGCFKCWICGTRLSLKTYFNNRNDTQDLEVSVGGGGGEGSGFHRFVSFLVTFF